MTRTPTEELILEVLAARYRLGESIWPFQKRLGPQLRQLERAGLIGFKGGIVEDTFNVWLTDEGKATYLSETYRVPEFEPVGVLRYRLTANDDLVLALNSDGWSGPEAADGDTAYVRKGGR